MSLITVSSLAAPKTISSSESDGVDFLVGGVLNITGTAQMPIIVTLSQEASLTAAGTINISYANVMLSGLVGVSGLINYNIGTSSTLDIVSTLDVAVGSTVNFTGPTGSLVLASGINPNLLGSVAGFGPGKSIDYATSVISRVQYVDATGNNTGGTINLYGSSGNQISSITLRDGNLTTNNFRLHSDGGAGTIIDFQSYVTGVTTNPSTAMLGLGQTAVFTVATSNPVTITGAPQLLLSDGGVATYDPTHSTSTQLAFNYTVAQGDTSSNLTVTGVNLNGGTLASVGGGGFDLSGAVTDPAGLLAIDGTPPVASTPTLSIPTGAVTVGHPISISIALSKPVTVTGSPTLTLNDNGTAIYDTVNSTPTTLVFDYVVQPGENTPDLAISAANPNGAVIVDDAGNPLNIASLVGTPTGHLVVDTIAPYPTSVVFSNPNGDLGVGDIVDLILTSSEPVFLTGGMPSIQLSDGGVAVYDASRSTSTVLVQHYTVQAGQNSDDLTVTGFNLNGGVLTDAAGNALISNASVFNPVGDLRVDTTAPTVTGVTTNPGSGTLRAGQTVNFTVAVTEPVLDTGSLPTLTLNDGGTATFDAADSTQQALVFTHTVQSGQTAADLAITGFTTGGSPITDAAHNVLDLSGVVANPAGILTVDTTSPVATGVTLFNGAGNTNTAGTGATIALTIALSEPVIVAGGAPTLTLNDGGIATLDTLSSTPTSLVFRYVVQAGDMTSGLAIAGVDPNGATLTDLAGNALTLGSLVTTPANTLHIDTLNPLITSVTTNPGAGDLHAGQTVAITLALNEAVNDTGSLPSLMLSDGGTATFDAADSTPQMLVFTHTILPGQTATDLAIIGVANPGNPLTSAGNAVLDLTSAITNPAGVLVVDTTAPTISALTVSPNAASTSTGHLITFSYTASEPLLISGGTPTLSLNDGATATFDPAASTFTRLVFDTIVQAGQNVAALAITGANLQGATLTDLAGNALDPASLVQALPNPLQIDTVAPVVTAVTADPAAGPLAAGQTVAISVALSKPILLGGTPPTLTLSDGGTAIYDAADSTPNMLIFTQIIQAGENTAQLAVTGVTTAGGTLLDAAGNPLDLAGAIGNLPGMLVVDTTIPAPPVPAGTPPAAQLVDVSLTPGTGTVSPGAVLQLVISTTNPVTVVGGIPTLALSDGGLATYDPTLSTPTQLVFTSVVQPGERAANLTIVGYNLNGATIADATGQLLSLTAAQVDPAAHLAVIDAPVTTIPTGVPDPGLNPPVTTDPNAPSTPVTTTPVPPTQIPATPTSDPTGTATPTGAITDPTSGTVPAGTASAPTSIPVYRFFEQSNGTHFYTSNATERDTILQTRPDLTPEGVGLRAADPATDPAAAAVYRFFDTVHGTQFLTDSTVERDTLIGNRPDLTYEPNDVFYEHLQPQAGDTAVYRFFDNIDGTHFYTDSATERAQIIQTRPDLVNEGIGFYEPK